MVRPRRTGKTRLALEVGAEQESSFADGVWLVEPAGVTDPEAVTSTVASALGLRDSAVIPLAGAGGSLRCHLLEHLDGARSPWPWRGWPPWPPPAGRANGHPARTSRPPA